MEKLFLVDAYALIFRAYYAFLSRPMRNAAGLNTSAIFGFTKFVRDIIVRERPRYLGVAFDPKGGNFRHELYPLYKANRSATPEDILLSVPYIKRILAAMRVPILEVAGYEADDVIGTLAVEAAAQGFETYMVTPDKDYGQLVSPRAVIYKQRKSGDGAEIIDRAAIKEHYGVDDPRLIIDILALWGDSSDNVPGVPGIGEKGAIKLVNQFGTVENILANIDSLAGRQRENIIANREQLLLAKTLVTIDTHVPIDFAPASLEMEDPDCDALREVYTELGFNMFLREMASDSRSPFNSAVLCRGALPNKQETSEKKQETIAKAPQIQAQPDLFSPPDLFSSMAQPAQAVEQPPELEQGDLFSTAGLENIHTVAHTYTVVDSEAGLRELVAELSDLQEFAYDTENTGYDYFGDRMVGLSLCAEPHRAYYIPLTSENTAARMAILRPLFENEKIAKIGQNIKFDNMFLRAAGVTVRGRMFDTMILHYLLDAESRHGMNHLAHRYLNYDPIPITALIGSGARQLTMDMVPVERVAEYCAEDADVTLRLKRVLWPMVEEQRLTELYTQIEEPLIDVLADMEWQGVRIDTAKLAEYAVELTHQLEELERKVREMADEPTLNVNSPKQLGEVLFGKMQLDGKPKMTKTKKFSTGEETLQNIADKHPIVGLILEYRGVKKLLSTYVEALPQLVNPRTGRIHTSYNQAVTATGRLSSTNPNLQNIPVREEQGRKIREAFVPSDGDHLLLSADYSQVELRLMAHLSGDVALVEAFRAGEDVHRATAARIFGVPLSEVTSDQRRKAKTANFGIIYGISAFGLSQRLHIPRYEARDIIEGYFRSYPGVKRYMERVVEEAREVGYVTTLFGRRRFLADINSRNAVARGLAERNAINAPLQGSAADIMKIAMIAVARGLRERGLRSKMILQVHDEVVIDTVRSEREAVATLVLEAMEHAARLAVELVVDYGVGENWLAAH
ncbi:MAG: DNA polymerase I [Rikenellaceae bacterium]|jgi:DNA polymerase-1|nr:DNA polymerase I [Rikenellaceae bacterium]